MKVLQHNTKAIVISTLGNKGSDIHHEMEIDFSEKGVYKDQIIYHDKKSGMSKIHSPKDGWYVLEVVEIK